MFAIDRPRLHPRALYKPPSPSRLSFLRTPIFTSLSTLQVRWRPALVCVGAGSLAVRFRVRDGCCIGLLLAHILTAFPRPDSG